MLTQKRTLVKPGAHNTLAARIIEQAGLECCGAAGYGVLVSLLGKPDVRRIATAEILALERELLPAEEVSTKFAGTIDYRPDA